MTTDKAQSRSGGFLRCLRQRQGRTELCKRGQMAKKTSIEHEKRDENHPKQNQRAAD
ncbi:MAG: hypothetical protein V7L29_08195 [Nostoc sp.]|uniref:hypothetical protein n=1 Tax=Nostoc sp. TaxID=1180 RepID=UPI002FF70D80